MAGISIPISLADRMSSPFDDIYKATNRNVKALEKMKGLMESDFVTGLYGLGSQTQKNTRYQEEHNRSLSGGVTQGNSLLRTIKGIGAAYLGLQGVKKLISIGDSITGTMTGLKLVNAGLQSVDDLNRKIFESAQRTRSPYMETAQAVSKIGNLAKDAFSSNDEVLAFVETMNKGFKLSGATATEQAAATHQLTQALASGRLQGDEMNSIRENFPMLAQAIQKELGGISLKEISEKGLATADVIKRAMFNMTDDINRKFGDIPITFTDIKNKVVNNFLAGMSPLWGALSRLWNNKYVKDFVENSIVAFHILGNVAGAVVDGINGAITFLGNNMDILGPIILGVAAAFAVYNAELMACVILKGILSGIETAYIVVLEILDLATKKITLSQSMFNGTLLACPITWIILGVIAVIAIFFALIAVINRVTGSHISAVGLIVGAFFFLGTAIMNIFKYIWNIIASVAEFLVNVFNHPVESVIILFLNLVKNLLKMARSITSMFDGVATNIANAFISGANMAITAINWIIKALNKIPGVNIGEIGKLSHTTSITHSIDNKIGQIDGLIEKTKPKGYWTAPKAEFGSLQDSFSKGYKIGEGFSNKVKGMFKMDKKEADPTKNVKKYLGENATGANNAGGAGGGKAGKALKDTAANTKKIAENTDKSKLDVRYLREMVERQAINRFTTAEINIQNSISQVTTEDLDGFVDHLNNQLEERLERQTEGYYTA